jgi:hypothetical protein
VGRDSSVGIATRYGLNGPGIESRWGARFSAPVKTVPGAHPASYKMSTGSLPGVKRTGYSVDHLPTCSVDVKERVELYLYSTSGPSWSLQAVRTQGVAKATRSPMFNNINVFQMTFVPFRVRMMLP